MPIELLRSGSIGTISYIQRSVNIQGLKFSDFVKEGATKNYDLQDNTGKTLTTEQAEYFKDSKARDKDGNLLVLHHGTSSDFTVFDRRC